MMVPKNRKTDQIKFLLKNKKGAATYFYSAFLLVFSIFSEEFAKKRKTLRAFSHKLRLIEEETIPLKTVLIGFFLHSPQHGDADSHLVVMELIGAVGGSDPDRDQLQVRLVQELRIGPIIGSQPDA